MGTEDRIKEEINNLKYDNYNNYTSYSQFVDGDGETYLNEEGIMALAKRIIRLTELGELTLTDTL